MAGKVGGRVNESDEGEEQGVESIVKTRMIDKRWLGRSQTGREERGSDGEDIG